MSNQLQINLMKSRTVRKSRPILAFAAKVVVWVTFGLTLGLFFLASKGTSQPIETFRLQATVEHCLAGNQQVCLVHLASSQKSLPSKVERFFTAGKPNANSELHLYAQRAKHRIFRGQIRQVVKSSPEQLSLWVYGVWDSKVHATKAVQKGALKSKAILHYGVKRPMIIVPARKGFKKG